MGREEVSVRKMERRMVVTCVIVGFVCANAMENVDDDRIWKGLDMFRDKSEGVDVDAIRVFPLLASPPSSLLCTYLFTTPHQPTSNK